MRPLACSNLWVADLQAIRTGRARRRATRGRTIHTRQPIWRCRRGCRPERPATDHWPSPARPPVSRCRRGFRPCRSRAEGRAARLRRAGIARADWRIWRAVLPEPMTGWLGERRNRGTERSAGARALRRRGWPGPVPSRPRRDRSAPVGDWRRRDWVAGLGPAVRCSVLRPVRARSDCRGRSSRWESRRPPVRPPERMKRSESSSDLALGQVLRSAARFVGRGGAARRGFATIAKDRWDRMGSWDRTALRHRLVLKMKKAPGGEPWLGRRFGGSVSAADGGSCGRGARWRVTHQRSSLRGESVGCASLHPPYGSERDKRARKKNRRGFPAGHSS
jgi:hypothetical protein